jgi:hypothetical protein
VSVVLVLNIACVSFLESICHDKCVVDDFAFQHTVVARIFLEALLFVRIKGVGFSIIFCNFPKFCRFFLRIVQRAFCVNF